MKLSKVSQALTALVVPAVILAISAPAFALPSTKPQATYQTNGRVDAIVYSGTTVYLVGAFTSVRPAGAPLGTGEVARNNAAAFDVSTGNVLPWNPNANGEVQSLAVEGGRVYLGGLFTTLGGLTRRHLAAVDPSSGAAQSWRPNVSASVRAIVPNANGRVYFGGAFSTVNGSSRTKLAAVNASDASLVATWAPSVAGTTSPNVDALAVSADGTGLYVGGTFTTLNGVSRPNAGEVRLDSGAAMPWNPKPGWPVREFAVSSQTGNVYTSGAGAGGHASAFSSGGALLWAVATDGDVPAIVVSSSTVYLGGHYTQVSGVARKKLAALDPSTGALLSWNPGANSAHGVYALALDPSHLAAGGEFTIIGGTAQQGFGQLNGTP